MTDLRQAAQAVIDRWDSPLWKNGSTADAIADLRTALEQQAEPVAWNKSIRDSVDLLLEQAGYQPDSSARHQLAMMNFDSAPPQRQWVGLTDEEIDGLRKNFATRPAIKAIEAKLKEKNT